MAFDPELEQHVRAALDGLPWLGEKRMFGGLAWMVDGNMLCAAITPGLMARVGKAAEAEMLALPGVGPMGSGARRRAAGCWPARTPGGTTTCASACCQPPWPM